MTLIPTERTTAGTDLLLAMIALGCVLAVLRLRLYDPWKSQLWALTFGTLMVASGLGSVAHGIRMPPEVHRLFWYFLNCSLGLSVALLVVASVRDRWGEPASRRILPTMLAAAVGFSGATVLLPHTFLAFVIYELFAMLMVVGVYGSLALHERQRGCLWMAAGTLLTMLAAAVQATFPYEVRCVWTFDHNGIFHLIQAVAVVCLAVGVTMELQMRRESEAAQSRC